MRDLFADFDEEPFALASLGQVHRARTTDGEDVAVKVQHPGAAEAVEADLRAFGLVGPVLQRLAPGARRRCACSHELRERISDELDYEIEAQHQRRLERRFRGHPHVRLPRVHTGLSARRVLVTEYVDGLRTDEIAAPRRRRARPLRRDRLPVLLRSRCGVTASSRATRTRTTASSARTGGCACSTSACCATSTRTTATASATSSGRSPPPTRRASMTACRASAICPTRERSTRTRCSSTSRPPASG